MSGGGGEATLAACFMSSQAGLRVVSIISASVSGVQLAFGTQATCRGGCSCPCPTRPVLRTSDHRSTGANEVARPIASERKGRERERERRGDEWGANYVGEEQ